MIKENKFIKFAIPAIGILLCLVLSSLCVTFIWSVATGKDFNIIRQVVGGLVVIAIVVIFYIYLVVCVYLWFMDNYKKDWYQYYILRARYSNRILRLSYKTFRGDREEFKYVLMFRLRNIKSIKNEKSD